MWSRHTSPPSRGPPLTPDHRAPPASKYNRRQQAGEQQHQSTSSRCRARTWASMDDLAGVDVSPPSAAARSGGGVCAEIGGKQRGGREGSSLLMRPSDSRWSTTGASTGSCSDAVAVAAACRGVCLAGAEGGEDGEEEDAGRQGIRNRQRGGSGSMRSCLSGDSLAASDGGETDFADRTNSEVCVCLFACVRSCTTFVVFFLS